ncbi:hypothetical protein E4U57_006544 [Claviceps arundinis]|uniref:Uncharacterized protein n=1 Tax=Claviceps arundinis TaxID=1623583 RepID=A0ABQ7PGP9_9HYPO|nr:hypothetical protein E4U57_006544 [Claviceps arundinis]
MASGTRTAARGSEAPEPQVNNDQQVLPLATPASTATTPTDDEMAALQYLQHRLAMAELQKKIAQADSGRLQPGAPSAPLTDPAETTARAAVLVPGAMMKMMKGKSEMG